MVAAESAYSNDRVATAIREKLALYTQVLAGILRYGQKRGEFRADLEPQQTAHALMGAYMGLLVHQNLFRDTLSYDPVVDALDRLVLDGIKPPAGG
jgi:hypothetical protein